MNKNHDKPEAEIVDLADETAAQQNSEPDGSEEQPSAAPTGAAAGASTIQAELTNKLVRLQADFDNYRKRTTTGRAEAREEARREIILDLLPIYDNFQRALGHAQEQEDYGALRTGIQGIMLQMQEFFQRHNLREIPATTGTPFNPNQHDALGTVPGNDDNRDTIAQEILKGFELNGYVVRPAQVLVFGGAE